jgi:hypothetical protein
MNIYPCMLQLHGYTLTNISVATNYSAQEQYFEEEQRSKFI